MVKLIGTLTEDANPAGFGPTGLALLTASSAALSKLSSPEEFVTRSPDKGTICPYAKTHALDHTVTSLVSQLPERFSCTHFIRQDYYQAETSIVFK